jgi:hypothetical protein
MATGDDRCSTSSSEGWLNTKRSSYCEGRKLKAPNAGRAFAVDGASDLQDRYKPPEVPIAGM